MASQMIHLYIADKLIGDWEEKRKAQFLLGSIAPDAIHARDNFIRNEKRKVHFWTENKDVLFRIPFLLLKYNKLTLNFEDKYFLQGYFSHLVADNLWSHLVSRYYLHNLFGDVPREQAEKKYYSEYNALDIKLRELFEWMHLLYFLKKAKPIAFLNLLSRDEVGKWRDAVIDDLVDSKEKEREENILTIDLINEYVGIAVDVVKLFFNNDVAGLKDYLGKNCAEHFLIVKYI